MKKNLSLHLFDLLFDRSCSQADNRRSRGNMKSLLEHSTYMAHLNEWACLDSVRGNHIEKRAHVQMRGVMHEYMVTHRVHANQKRRRSFRLRKIYIILYALQCSTEHSILRYNK